MPRVTHVAKARKSPGSCRKCGKKIKPGESYAWFANRIGRSSMRKNFCAACPIRPSDLTTSDKMSQLYAAQEALEDACNSADDFDGITSALEECENEAREVAQGYLDSIDNMPESLQNGSQADEMREKAETIEAWADRLSEVKSDIESDIDEDNDDKCASCEKTRADHDASPRANGACECFEDSRIEDARTAASDVCGELEV